MKDYLKVYKAKIIVLAPTFVGSGKEISKKEYFLSGTDRKVIVFDPGKFYQLMEKTGRVRKYEDFLLNDRNGDLNFWMSRNNVSLSDVSSAKKYSVAWGDRMDDNKSKIQIMEFAKDPYGLPYVPGTGIKGMLRTILLDYEIMKNNDKYRSLSDDIRKYDKDIKRNLVLQKESKNVESKTFNTLNKDEKNVNNAVNDIMQGLIISDSKPLSIDRLVLCQKIEYHTNKEKKPLNIMRECLRPGTEIEFTITIDTQTCKYDKDTIMEAIKMFNKMYYDHFLSKFGSKPKPDNTVYLGGGVGFVSKTFIYSMFGEEGVKITEKVFMKTLNERVFRAHGHRYDVEKGVSPHIMKCTMLNDNCLQMGVCRFEMEELN